METARQAGVESIIIAARARGEGEM